MNDAYMAKELAREQAFEEIWNQDIEGVFSDVAHVYDRVNNYASLGMLKGLRNRFISSIDVRPRQKVLDVCAGTNVIGIELLKKQPDLDFHAVDRSVAMQDVGRRRAQDHGFIIKGQICDAHKLPFEDNSFDVVTLQYATRHLRVIKVFSEIQRVLKPGGHFYHCDMLRPANKIVAESYCLYLKVCLGLVSIAIRSGPEARKCRDYFVQAIRMFYSTEELSHLLKELGFSDVVGNSALGGTVAFHKACKV
jgi:demethylmenaquinone methyltransferase/2-methoxy-6-polyprenyl-1,4-benzoquinol methylase